MMARSNNTQKNRNIPLSSCIDLLGAGWGVVVWGVVDCKAKVIGSMESNEKKQTWGVYIYRNHVGGGME